MNKNTYIRRCIKEIRTHLNLAKSLHEEGKTKLALSVLNNVSNYIDFMWYTEVITYEQQKYLRNIVHKTTNYFLNIQT